MYHSEFVKLGPTRVTVKSDIKESTYRGKANYVILVVDGRDRYYEMENAECENFWTGHMGQTFTVEASGSRESAAFDYIGEDEPEQQQEAPRATPPAARQAPAASQSPRAAGPPAAAAQRPPANPATDPKKALASVRVALSKQQSLVKLTLAATMNLAEDWKAKYGSDMPGDLFQSINAMFYIELNRKHPMDGMPVNLDFKTMEPVTKVKAPAAPPPAPVAPEPAEPVEDDVPF